MYNPIIKRGLDLFISGSLILILSPLVILITCFLTVSNKGKPFFFQLRPGLKGKPFNIIKFKTMNDRVDFNGVLLPDNQRLTKVGQFVRKSSLDEIPQLINVLWGDMSLIGPRPLLMDYLSLYDEEQKRRHEVRPGITGWAQVNGRNAISWEEKFQFDVWYVDNLTFFLDCKIIWQTILKVVAREGITQSGHVTTEPFRGKNKK